MKRLSLLLLLTVAAIAAADEVPLDPSHGFPVSTLTPRPNAITQPHVATNGREFFVTWADNRYPNFDVYGGRFDAEGNALDPAGVLVHSTYKSDTNAVPIWNGVEYATFSSSDELGLWSARVTTAGEVLPGGPPLPRALPYPAHGATNGTRYVLASRYGLDVFDANFQHLGNHPLAGETIVHHADVASDGSTFLAVRETLETEQRNLIHARRVNAGGTPFGDPILIVSRTTSPTAIATRLRPDVIWNGSSYFVVWTDDNGVRGATISREGVVGPTLTIATGETSDAKVAWDGIAHVVLWNHVVARDNATGRTTVQVRGAVLVGPAVTDTFNVTGEQPSPELLSMASNGRIVLAAVGSEIVVIRSTGSERILRRGAVVSSLPGQRSPAMAVGTTNLLAAWTEGRNVYAGRITRNGQPLDGAGIQLGTSGGFDRPMEIVSNGRVYLVIWQAEDGVRLARIREDGTVLDPGGVPLPGVPANFLTPVVAASRGGELRIVWSEPMLVPGGGTSIHVLRTASIPESGPLTIAKSEPLHPHTFSQAPHALLATDDGYTLIWQRALTPPCAGRFCNNQWELRGARLDRTESSLIATTMTFAGAATNGREVLIAMTETPLGQPPVTYTRRLTREGAPLSDRQPLLTVAGAPIFPRLTRTPNGYLFVHTVHTFFADRTLSEIRALPLDDFGTPRGSETRLLAGDATTLTDVVFDGRTTWVAYMSGWQPLPDKHSGLLYRAYVRPLTTRRQAVAR